MSLAYTIHRAAASPPLDAECDSPLWRSAPWLEISHFHPAGSDHRPAARARLLYDPSAIYVQFCVDDRYVLSTRTTYQDSVYRDSCVEFFLQPKPQAGYFNIEMNCGGTLLFSYIEDSTRTPQGLARFTPIEPQHAQRIQIAHSLPKVVSPENPNPIRWQLGYRLPIDILEAYTGPLGTLPGQTWRANFYKCSEDNSHPHWGSWSPIGDELNFHQPQRFAPIHFASNAAANSPQPA